MSEEWKVMTEEEKQPYKDAAAADAERARAENEAAGLSSGTAKKRKTAAPRKTKQQGKDGVWGCCVLVDGSCQHQLPTLLDEEDRDGPTTKPNPVTKRQQALAATQAPLDNENDEQEREQCDWEKHPAECILAETYTGKVCVLLCTLVSTLSARQHNVPPPCTHHKFVVSRRGLPLFEYGLVDAATVRAQRMGQHGDAPCPVSLTLLEDYERFVAEFRKETVRCTLDNELDLGRLCVNCECANYECVVSSCPG